MNPSPRLPHLRYGLARAYARAHADTPTAITPGLHHLLAVPIRERLILLAKIDGAKPSVIRRILHVRREDAEATSPEMLFAIRTWQQTLDDAYWHLPEKHGWRKQKNVHVERSLRQMLWADVAVALIGDGALPEIVNRLSLRKRLILYSLVVAELQWDEVMRLFRCTNWELRQAILDALEVVKE